MSTLRKPSRTSYSEDHAEIYDAIHSARGRDWAGEADEIAGIVRSLAPEADSLLDVACGTGAHMAHLSTHFSEVEGVEISSGMRRLARERVPDLTVHEGDMRGFDLGRGYDAVICMCFSLGYMASTEELQAAAGSMVGALNPGGAVVLEPWWFPERFIDGFVAGAVAEGEGRVISRLSHSERLDAERICMTVRYTVAESSGIREFTEHEYFSLFSRADYESAFAEAGLELRYTEGGPNGRGLFTGALH